MGRIETNFKQTEVGLIPVDWEVKKLGEVAEIFGGGTPSTFIAKYWNGDINWFTPTEIGSEKFATESLRKITRDGLHSCSSKILPAGSILITTRAAIGNASILLQESATNQGFQSLVVKNNYDNHFIYYLILTLKQTLLQRASGSTFLEISPKKVKEIEIPLPTKTEQTAIANVLSDADLYIESLEKLIDKKQKIKQGSLQQLLKPKPHWEVKKLGEVVNIKKGELITNNTRVNGDIPVIAGGRSFAYYNNKANRFGKTITISASGASAGYVAFHNYPIFASDCSTIEEGENYSIEFVFFYLQLLQDKIYKMQTGGAQPHIHSSDLNPIEIIIPKTKTEQQQIAKTLSDIDNEITALNQKLTKAKAIKQGMMQQLLTGKIRLI